MTCRPLEIVLTRWTNNIHTQNNIIYLLATENGNPINKQPDRNAQTVLVTIAAEDGTFTSP